MDQLESSKEKEEPTDFEKIEETKEGKPAEGLCVDKAKPEMEFLNSKLSRLEENDSLSLDVDY